MCHFLVANNFFFLKSENKLLQCEALRNIPITTQFQSKQSISFYDLSGWQDKLKQPKSSRTLYGNNTRDK
jgi:hypothetical protein